MIKHYNERNSVLNTDMFDRSKYEKLLRLSPKMRDCIKEGNALLPSFLPLMGDVWASFYKLKPEIKEEVTGDVMVNQSLLKRVMTEDHFETFRQTTKLDDLSSALGTLRYSEKVTEWLAEQQRENEKMKKAMQEWAEEMKKARQAQEKQEKAEKELQQAQQEGDQKKQTSSKRKVTMAQKQNSQVQEQLNQTIQQYLQQLNQQMEKNGQQLSDAMQQAEKETKEDKQNLKDLLSGGAGNGEAELKKIPLGDQLTLATSLYHNPNLRKIAEWAGKFKAIAKKKQKVKHQKSLDRSGVTLGDEIERLLPQELAFMMRENTKLDFLRRFSEKQTMIYSPEGKDHLGKGPLILCLDQSGSMDKLDTQSKGFALAIAMIAKKQGRDFAMIPFSVNAEKAFIYKKGKMTPSELEEFATTFLSGGTMYAPPLDLSRSLIENKSRFRQADIIFVTDGVPSDRRALPKYLEDKFIPFKKKYKVNIISLLLGKDVRKQYVEPFSDKIILASDFENEQATDVFTI